MEPNSVITTLINNEGQFFALLCTGVFALWITLSAIAETLKTMTRERTKREIAAYIAEGTMTPEQGERLIKAGKREPDKCA
jgi:hypothetical protein